VINRLLIRFSVFILLLITGSALRANTLEVLKPIFEPINLEIYSFEPIDVTNTYSLIIDPEKSFYTIGQNPYFSNDPSSNNDIEPDRYLMAGEMMVVTKYKEEQGYWDSQGKVSEINIESEFEGIDFFSDSFFWGENYSLWSDFFYKDGSNPICVCITMVDVFAPSINGTFEQGVLELNGSGLFDKDELTGAFQLDSTSSGNTTHQITYHIEAKVVSSVPVPAAFYLFCSAISGLMITRFRKSILEFDQF